MRFLVKETKGSTKSKPYVYSLEEIELSDGHNDAVESGHTRKSDRTIPMANILKDVRKSNDPGKFLLEESAKADKNKEEQNNSILYSVEDDEETQRLFSAAKEIFGTTDDLREAGYVLPDGTMLDFSGRHMLDPGSDSSHLRGARHVDHREIQMLNYEADGNTPSGMNTSMEDFIGRGAIRIDDNAGSINLSRKPTPEQARVLRRLIQRNDGYVMVDIGNGWDSEHYGEYDEGTKAARILADIDRYFDEGIRFSIDEVGDTELEESRIRFSKVEDPAEIERLESEPKNIGYRNVVLNDDGTMGSPMASKLGNAGKGRKGTTPFEMNVWEKSDENPDLADENGKIDLIKPDGKTVGKVDYNPYIHIRPDKVNKQFKQAWERPNLAYVKVEYPASEETSGYKADKAKKSVGRHPWNGEELILSRWNKVVEIVPWEEVADDWVKRFGERGVEFDIVPPKLLPILVERGVRILPPHKGMGKACNDAYEDWKSKQANAPEDRAVSNGVRYSKDKNNNEVVFEKDPFAVEDEKQKEIWKNAIRSLDRPRHANAPGRDGSSKSLSAANIQRIETITKFLDFFKEDIEKHPLEREKFLARLAGSLGFRMYDDDSRYGKPITIGDGGEVTVRVSNHNAKAKNFEIRHSNKDKNYGIIIHGTPEELDKDRLHKPRFREAEGVNYLELDYYWQRFDQATDEQRQRLELEIIEGVSEFINTGSLSKMPVPNKMNGSGVFKGIIDGIRKENPGILFSISPEEDAEYMDAVERGDMEKTADMVKEAAKRAMPNTKVVDKYGKKWGVRAVRALV